MDWVAALALLLLVEGLFPFAMPRLWRTAFSHMMAMSDGQVRVMGLLSMAAGLGVLFWVH